MEPQSDTNYFRGLGTTVSHALAEDIDDVDITASLLPAGKWAVGEVISRQQAVIAGRPWVDEVFRQVDDSLAIEWDVDDGAGCDAGARLFTVSGHARGILTAERTALNFLQTLSGTATTTRRYARLIEHTGAQLLDTRKTLPGLRRAQKYAVHAGGAANHRMGLSDAFLIKENHIAAAGSIQRAIAGARAAWPGRRVEIEVENLTQFHEAVDAAPDWIMLDNFSLTDLQAAVAANTTPIRLEASGGIESDSDLIAIAETGVDFISVGALTKHCFAIDLSLRLV